MTNALRSSAVLALLLGWGMVFSPAVLPEAFAQTNPPAAAAEPAEAATSEAKSQLVELSVDEQIERIMEPVAKWSLKTVFTGVGMEDAEGNALKGKGGAAVSLSLVVVWLVGAALILTLIFGFLNLRGLPLALATVRGKYDQDDAPGEVTHFQALTAAVSATVGLGNIAGVAAAISLGGPGAAFWMIVVGFLGMTTKFAECTLGVKYRIVDKKGKVFGGPMYYLRDGLKERDMKGLGLTLGIGFAIMCAFAALGGGNMFQINQATEQLLDKFDSPQSQAATVVVDALRADQLALAERVVESGWAPADDAQQQIWDGFMASIQSAKEVVAQDQSLLGGNKWIIGLIFALLVALVIIGGIKSIAKVTSFLVPLMCGMYIIACLIVIATNWEQVIPAFETIWTTAFRPEAGLGGIVAVIIIGVRRAAFSNEAGFGSAPIAHAAAKTHHAASEGLVALLEPFIDTIIVCTMTALVIVVSGVYTLEEFDGLSGISMTSAAFDSGIGTWGSFDAGNIFTYILTIAVILFAFSTMISWSYYGQQACQFLFGKNGFVAFIYKLLFCAFVVIGAAVSLDAVLGFSDAMLFGMCIFNLIGVYMLLPVVKRELRKYREYVKDTKRRRKNERRGGTPPTSSPETPPPPPPPPPPPSTPPPAPRPPKPETVRRILE